MEYLYAIRPADSGGLEAKPLLDIPQDTEKAWLEALHFIGTVEHGSFRYVERNYKTFKRAVEHTSQAARSPYSRKLGEVIIEVTGSAMDWLGSFRFYIDYMSSNSVGETRSEFKTRCSKEYDECRSYRFAWHLRNYAQHCGIPLHTVRPPDGECFLNRDKLLQSYEWKANLREEILRGPAEIDLVAIVDEAMNSLRSVAGWVREQITPHLTQSLQQAREFQKYFREFYDGWSPATTETSPDDLAMGQSISISILPLWQIETVEQMIKDNTISGREGDLQLRRSFPPRR